MRQFLLTILWVLLFQNFAFSQFDEDQLGAWYMYFFNTTFNESQWEVQGDVQFRNWNLGGDLEQLLLRGGFTYQPKNEKIKLTLGYGNITTGAFGDDSSTTAESRIYTEALYPVKFGQRIYTNHRFRYEYRFVEGQDSRTRYRYNLFINIPINNPSLIAKTYYLALYNELFINGQRDIGDERSVEIFDRNRFYFALGYVLKEGANIQFGVMRQSTDNWTKHQLQTSFHHKF